MPNQKQFDTTLQSIRNIDCKLFVLDYDYTILDEISGKTESISLSVNAESDIRRTANINVNLLWHIIIWWVENDIFIEPLLNQ